MSQNLDRDAAVKTKDDDWAWRRRIRANPATARVYRIGVFVAASSAQAPALERMLREAGAVEVAHAPA